MKVYLTRRYWLSASHRLHSEKLSDEQNQAIYGKCTTPMATDITMRSRLRWAGLSIRQPA